MKSNNISIKTLRELLNIKENPQTFNSTLISKIGRLLDKKIDDLNAEDLRLLIVQKIGLNYIVPIAISYLKTKPLQEAFYYPGDLLYSVLKIKNDYWQKHPRQKRKLSKIVGNVDTSKLADKDLISAINEFLSYDNNKD